MFGFFKNRQRLQKRIKSLEKGLHYSFSKIKEDFHSTHDKIDKHASYTDKKLEDFHNRLLHIEKLFSEYLYKITSQTSQPPETEEESLSEKPLLSKLNSLTDAQKQLFMEIIGLHLESGMNWISFIDIAKQLYPDKDYNTVRSTISEFTSILEELGLIQKKIQRKKGYVKVTVQGIAYLDKDRAKRLKKLIKIKEH